MEREREKERERERERERFCPLVIYSSCMPVTVLLTEHACSWCSSCFSNKEVTADSEGPINLTNNTVQVCAV